MDKIKLKAAIADHVEVLIQYQSNTTTDKDLLKDMIINLFAKFTKKEIFLQAVYLFNEKIHGVDDQMLWTVSLEDSFKTTFPDNETFPAEIVNELKKIYKIK
jgi:hypothetical protein